MTREVKCSPSNYKHNIYSISRCKTKITELSENKVHIIKLRTLKSSKYLGGYEFLRNTKAPFQNLHMKLS